MNERDVKNVDLRLFCLKWEKKLIETLKRDWLKKVELMMSLLKRYLVNHHQIELPVEYHDKYLKLKTLISNENTFKDSNDEFFLKYSSNFSKKQLKIQSNINVWDDHLINWS